MTTQALLLADALAVYAVFIAPWVADRKVRRLRADRQETITPLTAMLAAQAWGSNR